MYFLREALTIMIKKRLFGEFEKVKKSFSISRNPWILSTSGWADKTEVVKYTQPWNHGGKKYILSAQRPNILPDNV